MHRTATRRGAVLAAWLVALPLLASGGDDAERIRRLEAGEILTSFREVPGRRLPEMKAVGIVDAPPEKVWAVIDDCASYKETMPRTLESVEVERRGNRVRCRVTVDMPFPFDDLRSETDATLTVEPGTRYRREWTHRDGDFEVNDGSWTLEPWDGGARTLATYEALAEPDVPIPAFVLTQAQKVTLPAVIERLRERLR